MNCSTPGLPVHQQLPEFTQIHVHRVSDAIQPSHPLSSPFPPAPNPSQHQSLFQWVNSFPMSQLFAWGLFQWVFSNESFPMSQLFAWGGQSTGVSVLASFLPKNTKEQRLRGRRRAERSYSVFKVRGGSGEEITLVQGKEQRLRFAGAAVKRYPHPR